ncbi:MAG: HEAT repeat domain-containing protein, partial [candidate division WOR-3 bacterium]
MEAGYFKNLLKWYTKSELIQKALNDDRITIHRYLGSFLGLGYATERKDLEDYLLEIQDQDSRPEPLVDRLLRALNDTDPILRREAAWDIGSVDWGEKIEEVANALIKALKEDKDSRVRFRAAMSLGDVGASPDCPADKRNEIIDALIEALEKEEYRWVREDVAEALGKIGVSPDCPADKRNEIIDALIEALEKEEYSWVREYVAEALGKIGVSPDCPADKRNEIFAVLIEDLKKEKYGDTREIVYEALKALIEAGAKMPGTAEGPKIAKGEPPIFPGKPDFEEIWPAFEKLAKGNRNLVYNQNEVQQYHSALWSNPKSTRHFVILAGPSGTGKTKLSEVYAEAVVGAENKERRVKLVAIRPEWTDARDFMGYWNPIANEGKGAYCDPNGIVEFIKEAEANPNQPYFLILDEMNIAHVEYYFSDFLSGMESGEPIKLHGETFTLGKYTVEGGRITIPPNLFVTGTINVDETTHEISPKVLDRAYVLVLKANWEMYYEGSPLRDDPELGEIFEKLMGEGGPVRAAGEILEEAGLGFGYRTAEDIVRYVAKAKELGTNETGALDQMFISKILPKIKGTESE